MLLKCGSTSALSFMIHMGFKNEENADEEIWTVSHTRKCQLRQNKQIQAVNLILVRSGKN